MGNCCSQPPATSERPKEEEPAKPAWFGAAADRTGAAPTTGQKAKLVAAI